MGTRAVIRTGQPLAKCFLRSGRREQCLYAVCLREHPGIVKVGKTTKWASRRRSYDGWNFARGDGVADFRRWLLTDEYVDMNRLEAGVLSALPYPLWNGREWYRAELEDVARFIDGFLCEHALSYV